MRNIASFGLVALVVACTGDGGTKTITITKDGETVEVPVPGPTVTIDDCDRDGDKPVCFLRGVVRETLTLTADTDWVLEGGVFVGVDNSLPATLTIDPGTTIYGEASTRGMLVVTRGSKLIAAGTAAAPIVMTSSNDVGSRARGDWGGLIINGNAPINGCDADADPCEAAGEGGTGTYGGTDPADDSGTLQYVRVEYAGTLISPDNELNGIAFQGVGSGTTVDHLHVHMNADDGVEFFGGTVDAKYILTTGIGDDNIDWTQGWVGRLQYVIGQQYSDTGDQGIEADNNADDNDSLPRSSPVLSNVTMIGSPLADTSDYGALLREGTAGQLWSTVLTEFNDACLALSQGATLTQIDSGDLVMANSILNCAKLYESNDGSDPQEVVDADVEAFYTGGPSNVTGDPGLEDPLNEAAPNFAPTAAGLAATGGATPSDTWFDQVTFRGGMDVGDDWTEWTSALGFDKQ